MCSKVGYYSFNGALRSMQHQNRYKGFNLKGMYQCSDCGKWHLTSQQQKPK